MSDMTTPTGDTYYYANGKRVPLVQEPGVFAVRYRVAPRLLDLGAATDAPQSGSEGQTTSRSLGQDLSPMAKRLLRDNTEDEKYIPNYNIQVYRSSDAGQTQSALGREDAVVFSTPVFKRSPDSQSSDALYVTNQFLAQFKPHVTRAQIEALCRPYAVRIVSPLAYAPNGFLFEIEDGPYANRAVAVANAFFESGLTVFSHPNFVRKRYLRSATAVPDMHSAAPVAARDSTEGQYLDRQWHLDMAHVTDAWDIRVLQNPMGSPDIVIAILDDGVDTSHPDFNRLLSDGSSKIAGQFDFATNSSDASPKRADDNHGTACAGVATAWGKGYGAAPGCRLLIARTPDFLGVAEEGKMFQWAADSGADVISCSWGPQDGVGMVEPLADSTQTAIHYCITNGRSGKGIPIFWAAGNGNESLEIEGQPGQVRDGYAGNPDVMAIAASTRAETRAYYSDFGPEVCICAPSSGSRAAGEKSIFTTDRHGAEGYNNGTQPQGDTDGDYTSTFGGTSSATPLAAGIGALILSVNPNLTAGQVRQILQATADKIGPASGYDSSGHSDQFGHGRVNAKEAVLKAMGTTPGENVSTTPNNGTGHQEPAPESDSPQIQIIGSESLQQSDPAPSFEITTGQNRYYIVEFATRHELFDGANHISERNGANFYGSWQENRIFDSQNTSTYVMPDPVWDCLKLADRIYYRVGTTAQADTWDNYQSSTLDQDTASAPFFTLGNVADRNVRSLMPRLNRDVTSEEGNGTGDGSMEDDTDDSSGSSMDNSSSTKDDDNTSGTADNSDNSSNGSDESSEEGTGTADTSGDSGGMSIAPIHYEVELIPQPDKLSCWAGSMAMLVGYQRQVSLTPESLAQEVGRSLRTSYGWDMLEAVKDHFGFQEIPLPSNASLYPPATQWRDWLNQLGPLWVTTIGAPSHAIVVRGISGDMTLDGTQIEILNPWDTSQVFSADAIDFSPANNGIAYSESFRNFAAEFGDLGLDDYGNWRVLYLHAADMTDSGSDAGSSSSSGSSDTDNGGGMDAGGDAGSAPARTAPGTTGTQAGIGGYSVYESEVRVGGTLAWRNNNPGNIRPGQFTRDHGSIGQGWGFAVFPDEQTGFDAIIALLKTSTYQSKTIKGAIFTYAPPSDNNNSEAYVAFIRRQTGLDPERNMNSLSDDELNAVARAIRTMEGWTPGTTYTCSTSNLPDWVRPLLGCGTTSETRNARMVADRNVSSIAASLPRLPLRPTIIGPASYDRNEAGPSFHITLGDNRCYGVEVTTNARLFDLADHGQERTDANFYASWTQGLQRAYGETLYVLPETAWARLKEASFLYYRVLTSSRPDLWTNTQSSLPDVLASRAPAIRLTGRAGARINTTAHHIEEELWNPDLVG